MVLWNLVHFGSSFKILVSEWLFILIAEKNVDTAYIVTYRYVYVSHIRMYKCIYVDVFYSFSLPRIASFYAE